MCVWILTLTTWWLLPLVRINSAVSECRWWRDDDDDSFSLNLFLFDRSFRMGRVHVSCSHDLVVSGSQYWCKKLPSACPFLSLQSKHEQQNTSCLLLSLLLLFLLVKASSCGWALVLPWRSHSQTPALLSNGYKDHKNHSFIITQHTVCERETKRFLLLLLLLLVAVVSPSCTRKSVCVVLCLTLPNGQTIVVWKIPLRCNKYIFNNKNKTINKACSQSWLYFA